VNARAWNGHDVIRIVVDCGWKGCTKPAIVRDPVFALKLGWSWVDCSGCGVHAQRVLTAEAIDLCRKHFGEVPEVSGG
jgi:hypothetical protein